MHRARPDLLRLLLLGPLCALLAGCSSGPCYQGESASALTSIYVVRRGWHTGVAVAAADWPNRRWPLLEQFADAEYLEFGWGDRRFYEAATSTFWLGSRAALWPTASAIHVIGTQPPVERHALADDVVEVRIGVEALQSLTAGIEREFAGDEPAPTGAAAASAPRPNRFYHAARSFYFPRMCNWWVARRLRDAGCPIEPWSVLTASRIMREARAFAAHERNSPR